MWTSEVSCLPREPSRAAGEAPPSPCSAGLGSAARGAESTVSRKFLEEAGEGKDCGLWSRFWDSQGQAEVTGTGSKTTQ